MHRLNLALTLFLLLLPLDAASSQQLTANDQYEFVPLVIGLDRPVYVTHAGDDRLFVVTQPGVIYVIQDGELLVQPFLDIQRKVDSMYSEEGLHSMAFDPNFAENGYFYVQYSTEQDNAVVIERYQVSPVDPNRATRLQVDPVLRVPELWDNHNGGQLNFGEDGYLYSSLGDGGSHNDPRGNGQNAGSLLGTILRLDVSTLPYTIPPDNPFVDDPFARPEVWLYGLRNPWRFSFDRATGDLYIGDVGQNLVEEIDVLRAGDPAGLNYGWNVFEGDQVFLATPGNVDESLFAFPVTTYPHVETYRFFTPIPTGVVHCSVTGGYVYRGEALPDLQGKYIYGDYCSGTIWTLYEEDGEWVNEVFMDTDFTITSFGEDAAGELYLTNFGDGGVYQLVERTD